MCFLCFLWLSTGQRADQSLSCSSAHHWQQVWHLSGKPHASAYTLPAKRGRPWLRGRVRLVGSNLDPPGPHQMCGTVKWTIYHLLELVTCWPQTLYFDFTTFSIPFVLIVPPSVLQELDSDKKKVVSKTLRFIAHYYAASLIVSTLKIHIIHLY